MARRDTKRRFPNAHVMAHAFVDALVAQPDINASNPIAKRVMQNVERITRSRRSRHSG